MKKYIITAISAASPIAIGVSTASAADIAARPAYKAPVAAPAVVANWTGFYFGVHGGFGGDCFEYP